MQECDKEEDNQVSKDDSNEDIIDDLGVNVIRNTYCSICGGSGTTRSDTYYLRLLSSNIWLLI